MFSYSLIYALIIVPLAGIISYYDVRYRRIPNVYVLGLLVCGLAVNTFIGGLDALLMSLAGCALAFGLMLIPHVLGAMGAGDVKLFAAIGAVIGLHHVLPTFVVVVMTGGLLALYTMLRSGKVFSTMYGVVRIFAGLLPGWEMPRFAIPADRRHTIPYGVAITLGSLISLAVFRV